MVNNDGFWPDFCNVGFRKAARQISEGARQANRRNTAGTDNELRFRDDVMLGLKKTVVMA